jgi:hypothetical protein
MPTKGAAVGIRLRHRAWRTIHPGKLQSHDQKSRAEGQASVPGACTHASPFHGLQAGRRRARYPIDPGLSWPQGHPAYGALHRAVAETVQGFLAGLTGEVIVGHLVAAVRAAKAGPWPVGSRETIKPRRAVIRADAPGPVDDETRPLSPPSPSPG